MTTPSPTPIWSQVEQAIIALVKSTTGLDDQHVYLAHQNGISPFPGPACVISFGEVTTTGGVDDITHDYDAARPAGQEIHYVSNGWRTFTTSLTFFSPTTAGDVTARTMAMACQAGLRMPSARSAINAANIGILDEGTVRWVPVQDSGLWYGSAVLELGLILRASATETGGYISNYVATVTVTNT